MAKRASVQIHSSRSRKTAKRLSVKRQKIAATKAIKAKRRG